MYDVIMNIYIYTCIIYTHMHTQRVKERESGREREWERERKRVREKERRREGERREREYISHRFIYRQREGEME